MSRYGYATRWQRVVAPWLMWMLMALLSWCGSSHATPFERSRIGIQNADTAASTVNTATLRYDSLGRLTSGVDADWHATQYNYDDLDRPMEATDRLGQLRSYQFDANGNTTTSSYWDASRDGRLKQVSYRVAQTHRIRAASGAGTDVRQKVTAISLFAAGPA